MNRVSLSALSAEVRKLQGGGRGKVLLAIAIGWGISVGARMIYPVVLPQLREVYALDLVDAGMVLTVLFAAYAIGQLPGGILADRIGERVTLTVSLLLSASALVSIILVRSRTALFVATALFGFGVGFYAIARFTAVVALYPRGYGTAAGVTNSAPAIGQAVLPPIAGSIAVLVGWQYGLGFTIPVFVLVAVALWVTLSKHATAGTGAVDTFTRDTVRTLLSALRDPSVVIATLILILGIFIWRAFTGFYPKYLIDEKGLSPTVASALFGLHFAGSALVHPLSGMIYDRWNVKYAFPIVAVAVVMLVGLPFVGSVPALIVVSILLGTLLGFETATESYLVDALPSDVEGTGFGILRTVVFATGSVSPILFGAVAELGFFDELFLLLAGVGTLMLAIATRLPVAQRSSGRTVS